MPALLRVLLSPLAPFWWLFAVLKRKVYRSSYIKRYESPLHTWGVGNLSMGGTGKTPFSIMLIEELLRRNERVAFLSRGYGRETKGMNLVSLESSAKEVGDEPLLVKLRFKDIPVLVCESRMQGLKFLEEETEVRHVVLDDVFQHLNVKAQFYFLLSTCSKPFYKDYIFPIGKLREPRFYAKEANALVFTKCDEGIAFETERLKDLQNTTDNFLTCGTSYDEQLTNVFGGEFVKKEEITHVLAFSGLANNEDFFHKVSTDFQLLDAISFSDHHNYGLRDLNKILATYDKFKHKNCVLMTTEKDAVRLQTEEAKSLLVNLPLLYWSISTKLLGNSENTLEKIIEDRLNGFTAKN